MIDKCYSFKLLNKKDLKKILSIRNQKKIREASFNKNIIKYKDHLEWFNKKKKSNFFNHYVLKHNSKLIGVGYGEKYSKSERSCLWGFYVDSKINSDIKYGSLIKYLLFEKLFKITEISSIECQVKEGYEWIKNWHIKWGHKVKDHNKDLKCYNLILKKKTWKNIKKKIYETGFKKN